MWKVLMVLSKPTVHGSCFHIEFKLKLKLIFAMVQNFGIAFYKSLIQYSQTAERNTLYLYWYLMLLDCRDTSMHMEVILYEGFKKTIFCTNLRLTFSR